MTKPNPTLTEVHISNMTDKEVIHRASFSDDPFVKRLLQVIKDLEVELSYANLPEDER